MKIARMPKGTSFTVTSNDRTSFAWDSRLSPNAYGILHKVLSLFEEKSHFSVAGLQKLISAGEIAIHSALNFLKRRSNSYSLF